MTQRNQGKTAVVGWGRGMGHKGHMLLASAVIHQAKSMNATPIFILSRTSLIDPNTGDLWADTKKVRATKDDPLTPQEKLAIYQKTFPEMAKIFTVADGESGSLNDALANLAKQGFSNIVLVVGADQKAAFQYLVNPSKDGSIPYQQMGLQNLVVMSRQETQAPGSDIEGPRATPMRQVLLDPKVSDEQRFSVWRDAMPDALSDKEVLGLMQKAQQRLGRAEQIAPPKQQKIKEFVQRVRPMLKEASIEQKVKILKLIKESMQTISTKNIGEGDVVPFKRPTQKQLTYKDLPPKVLQLANDWFWQEEDSMGLDAVMDPKGFGSGPKNAMQHTSAILQTLGWKIGWDDEYENLVLTNKKGQSVMLPSMDAYDFTGWAEGSNADLRETEDPYNLPNRHSMDYGMRKTMIHRLAKATDYDVSDLSLASDEELSNLYKEVFPDQSVNEDYLDEK